MAGDWIKMRSNLWDDPRIGRICDLTGAAEATVIGALYWLWSTADSHTEDGLMPGLSLRQIDRKTGVPGFGEALCNIGWLAAADEGVCLVNFEEHNGTSAKRRSMEAQRKATARNVSASDADNVRTEPGQDAPKSGQGAELEKRREEKNSSSLRSEEKRRAPRVGPDEVPATVLVDAGFSEQQAADFIAHKRSRKAPLTSRAWADHQREAGKAGWSVLAAAEKVMAKNWKGFEAAYVERERPPSAAPPPVAHESFRERDARIARERVAAFAPGVAARAPSPAHTADVIDLEDIHAPRRLG